jgi:hypothetical protein
VSKAKPNPLAGFTNDEVEEEARRRGLMIEVEIPRLPVVRAHATFTVRGPRNSYSSATFGYDIEATCFGRTNDDIVTRGLQLDELVTKMCRERREPALDELKSAFEAAEEKWGE